jgi:predicted transcriptional regulator
MAVLSFRTDDAIREQLDRIAKSLDRNRNWVINEAIQNYLELHRAQIEAIHRGEEDIRAGRWHTTEQVREHLDVLNARAKEDQKKANAQFKSNTRTRRKRSVA